MNICFITNYFDSYRGGNTLFADLFRSFSGRHTITIITNKDRFAEKFWKSEIVDVNLTSNFWWLNEYKFARGAVKSYKNLLKKNKFDVVLINQVIGTPIVKILETDIPAIYIVHHPVSVDIKLASQESASVFERMGWRMRYGNLASMQSAIMRKFSTLLTVSEASRNAISQDYGIDKKKIEIIYNGVETDFFQKTLPTESKTALSIGSYQHPRRGFKYLVEVYKRLTKNNWKILDVGRRTDKQSLELDKIKGVHAFGPVATREEIRDLYSRASITLSSSLFEGFGLSIAESLSCGTPVVAFRSGGVEKVLEGLDSRMMCVPRDVGAMVTNAISLDSEQSNGMVKGLEFRNHIVKKFDISKMSSHYEDLLSSVVKVGLKQ